MPTDPVVISIITACASVAAAFIGYLNNRAAAAQRAATAEIHVLVNSGATKAAADLAAAKHEIETLRELVSALDARLSAPGRPDHPRRVP
jgi:hypothetical protein